VKTFLVFQQATSLIAYCYEIVSYHVNFGHYVPLSFTVAVNEPFSTRLFGTKQQSNTRFSL
jgi:hypothetical protein